MSKLAKPWPLPRFERAVRVERLRTFDANGGGWKYRLPTTHELATKREVVDVREGMELDVIETERP